MLVDGSLVDDQNIICMVTKKKKPFMTAKQVQNILQDVGVHVSLPMFETRLYDLRRFGIQTPKPQKQKIQLVKANFAVKVYELSIKKTKKGKC